MKKMTGKNEKPVTLNKEETSRMNASEPARKPEAQCCAKISSVKAGCHD